MSLFLDVINININKSIIFREQISKMFVVVVNVTKIENNFHIVLFKIYFLLVSDLYIRHKIPNALIVFKQIVINE